MATKYSTLFGKTTRETSKDIILESHRLLYQGGFIRQSVAGRYYLLPLGMRVRNKIQQIIREEMNNADSQELISPGLQQLSLWKETKRDEAVNFELMQVEDRRGEKFALGGTAEEMIVDLVRKMQISYRELPFNIYQFSPKFRDEARGYGGLLRVREFIMKDGYSFDKNKDEFEKSYQNMWNTYERIYIRCGLKKEIDFNAIESSGGVMGDLKTRQFDVEHESGEDKYFVSTDGKYAAHEDIAQFISDAKNLDEKILDMKIVDVVRGNNVEEGCRVHKNQPWQHIKNVIYKVSLHKYSKYYSKQKEFIFVHVVIRGDLEVNEDKLQKIIDATKIDSASEEDLKQMGYVAGFISPVKTYADLVLGDLSLTTVRNATSGGDLKNKDRLNINYDRDYKIENLQDLALAFDGAESIDNHGKLILKHGTEVGQIFELGYKYSHAMNANFIDENGKTQPYYMGCYGIGLERTLQMIVEKNYDENGIVWPKTVAPFDVHIITIGDEDEIINLSKEIILKLKSKKYEILWDERAKVSPGVKFKDADLIGCPLQIVISKKSLVNQELELKYRNKKEAKFVKISEVGEIEV